MAIKGIRQMIGPESLEIILRKKSQKDAGNFSLLKTQRIPNAQ